MFQLPVADGPKVQCVSGVVLFRLLVSCRPTNSGEK